MNKNKRQQILLEIVSKIEVDTQEEILKALNSYGLNVTQATISRDIKELGLIKTNGTVKKYRYAQVSSVRQDAVKLLSMFKSAVTGISLAQNLIVVKTLIGNAGAVAASIDMQHIPEILGTIAGDDTVLVVAQNNQDALTVLEKIKNNYED